MGQNGGLSTLLVVCCPISRRVSLPIHHRLETCKPKDICGNQALSSISRLLGKVSPARHFLSSSYFRSWRLFDDFSKISMSGDFSEILCHLIFHLARPSFRVCQIPCAIHVLLLYDDWPCSFAWELPQCSRWNFLSLSHSASGDERLGCVGIPSPSFC